MYHRVTSSTGNRDRSTCCTIPPTVCLPAADANHDPGDNTQSINHKSSKCSSTTSTFYRLQYLLTLRVISDVSPYIHTSKSLPLVLHRYGQITTCGGPRTILRAVSKPEWYLRQLSLEEIWVIKEGSEVNRNRLSFQREQSKRSGGEGLRFNKYQNLCKRACFSF